MAGGGVGEAALLSSIAGAGAAEVAAPAAMSAILAPAAAEIGGTALAGGALSGMLAPAAAEAGAGALGGSLLGDAALSSLPSALAPAMSGPITPGMMASAMPELAAPVLDSALIPSLAGDAGISSLAAPASNPSMLGSALSWATKNPGLALMGGSALMGMLNDQSKYGVPEKKYNGPLSKFSYSPSTYSASIPRAPTFRLAKGGIASLDSGEAGRYLRGSGDGMSDDIPATIDGSQPARLADGEFVVPSDVVSHLGNGSSDAGAKQLHAMMDRIRKARTGNSKQGRQIDPSDFMPR